MLRATTPRVCDDETSVERRLAQWAAAFDRRFADWLRGEKGQDPAPSAVALDIPKRLHDAVTYSALAGGKRLRPFLVTRCCELAGGTADEAFPAAVAVECVHTFSLIHDDLPAMDDDSLRRGRPTCHKQFDEATAILAGDALLTLAFEVLSRDVADATRARAAVIELARGTGWVGMIGGQMADIEGEGLAPSADLTQRIHAQKTAALFQTSCRLGGIVVGAPAEILDAFGAFGRHLGHAFQISDDLLDITSTWERLGKGAGKDAAAGKQTYPAAHGVERSREAAVREALLAGEALCGFAPACPDLVSLARFVVEREH